MAEIGERLREARMRQRVDISAVENATKIRAKYLRALENEDFDTLPGPTFVKSFLRTYAEYLGLDARLLVEEYRVQHEPAPEDENQHFAPSPPRRPPGPSGPPAPSELGWIVGGALGLLLVVFLVIGLVTGDDDRRAPEGGPRTAKPEDGSKGGRRERRRQRSRGRRPGAAANSVTMRIVPAEPTYVCVDAGPGKVLYQGSLSSARTFKGRRLRLNLGKTTAVVRVNGRRVNLGAGANPVGFAFAPRGTPRPLPLGQRPCA